VVASTWWNPTALSAYVTIALLVVGIVSLILGYRSLIGLGRQVENVKEQLEVARENLRVDSQALLGTFRPVLIEAKLQGDSTSMGDRGILLRSADTQAELTLPIKMLVRARHSSKSASYLLAQGWSSEQTGGELCFLPTRQRFLASH